MVLRVELVEVNWSHHVSLNQNTDWCLAGSLEIQWTNHVLSLWYHNSARICRCACLFPSTSNSLNINHAQNFRNQMQKALNENILISKLISMKLSRMREHLFTCLSSNLPSAFAPYFITLISAPWDFLINASQIIIKHTAPTVNFESMLYFSSSSFYFIL